MDKIAQLINNGMILLGRKIDSLAIELRNRKSPETNISVDIGDNVAKGVSDAIKESISGLEMPKFDGFPAFPEYPAFPEIPAPQVTVNVPEIKLPTINVPETIVNVPAPVVNVEPTPVSFPSEMKVIGMERLIEEVSREAEPVNLLDGISNKNPIPMQMVDSKGKVMNANDFGGGLSGPSVVGLKVGISQIAGDNPLPTTDGLSIPEYDYVSLSYTGSNLTGVIFKTGGASGITVATLVLAYSGSNLTSVTKS